MRRLVISMLMVLLTEMVSAQETKIYNTRDIYWLGIDYNQCYFITSIDFYPPDRLYTELKAWNILIFNEKDKYIDRNFSNREIIIKSDFISRLNENVVVDSLLVDDLSKTKHLSKDDISNIVKTYNFPSDLSGVGLILIAESYSKPEEKGYYYSTLVDIKSKKVLLTERMSGDARGFGLRNYWARTYYKVLRKIGKEY